MHGRVLNVSVFLSQHAGGELAVLTLTGEFDMIHPPVVVEKYVPDAIFDAVGSGKAKSPRELQSRPCLLPLIRAMRLQIWRLEETGG